MKQVLQDLKSGAVTVVEAPEPAPMPGRILVRVQASLLSAGTESAQVAKARQSLLAKVREKPQLLRQGLQELRERGVAGVRQRIAGKFEGLAELGYSCAGVVVHSGDETGRIAPGMRVACGGVGFANHAEQVSVPLLLSPIVPDGVAPESAAYATVGAIAMQGIRQAAVQLGETVAVVGLGLVGLLAVQLLKAAGCRVVGVDPSEPARRRAVAGGADMVAPPENALDAAMAASSARGVDAVIICAATPASSPVELAGKIARSRGRVVMVGATGMTIPREDYYLKELSFALSRSYGPGRYDPTYEEEGIDYPFDYVRFTEQRNMAAFLELVASGRVNPQALTTHRFPIERAPEAYALLNDRAADRAGVILTYPEREAEAPPRLAIQTAPAKPPASGRLGVAFIGAGAYAQGMLLPLLKARADVDLRSVVTLSGGQGLSAARRFGFEQVCTTAAEVLGNPAVDLVFIVTRHDSHADLVCQALAAGKHVWVEKPLALTVQELKAVWQAARANPARRLVVGFNRTFSPDAAWLKQRLQSYSPPLMLYRVNAGAVPRDSWVNDPRQGGGRLLGEGCHIFDFLRWMAGSRAAVVHTETAGDDSGLEPTGNFATTVRFENGAVAQLLYSAQGSPAMEKEYFECFTGSRCGLIEDYRSASFFQGASRQRSSTHAQNKGQACLLDAYLSSLRQGTPAPIAPEDLLESSLLTLAAQQSLRERRSIALADLRQLLA